ncbi:ATPase involved in DNA repair/chromosome segregation, partial [Giardia duodenalis]
VHAKFRKALQTRVYGSVCTLEEKVDRSARII